MSDFVNRAITQGPAKGKTPLCYLAAQCLQGQRYQEAGREICTWLLKGAADPNLPENSSKCPFMLSAASGNADIFELLIEARGEVDTPRGPNLDAVLDVAGYMSIQKGSCEPWKAPATMPRSGMRSGRW